MNKTVRVSKYCPETGDMQTVAVTFAEVRMIGNPNPGYKATSYRCSYASEHGCNSNGANGMECPLVKEAIRRMTE